ncbi:glycosyltransferase family 2 protein [Sphingobium aromaticiconvertens]|uniref:glycosyltransferase family 2 protein n=1 Tax=Sphingobium aromaticiconvertens TaxID=365341 RepID=UPI0030166413
MMTMLLWLVCLGVALPVGILALECFVGTLASPGRVETPSVPPFMVLMPAHDEAAGIERSVADVLAQLRPCDRLLVVADNCTDDTAAIAERLGACVIERHDPALRGKSHALEFGRAFMASDPFLHGAALAVVIIVDADCSPEPGALWRLVATAVARDAVVQGAYLLTPPPEATPVVQMSCYAFMVKNLIRQIALRRLAGVALLQGSGMAFPMSVFQRIDWSGSSLVEDLDMGLRLLLDGTRVTFDETATFLSPASSQGGTASQRRRWEHGMMQSMHMFVPGLLKIALLGRPRWIFLALDQIIPPTILLTLTAGVMTGMALAVGGLATPVVILLLCDFALAAGLFVAWIQYGRALLPWRNIVASARYIIWKLPIFVQFVTRRQRQWIRTDRVP